MRQLFLALSTLCAVAVLAVAGATDARAQSIANTKHDFTFGTNTVHDTANVGGQICIYCHTPHAGDVSTSGAPLWNRTLPDTTGGDGFGTFSMYLNRTLTPQATPSGISLACLSCHDGTLAIDQVINSPGSGTDGGAGFIFTGLALDGTMPAGITDVTRDLSNDHPISMGYPVAGNADFNPLPATLPVFVAGAADLVECATCHDPHNDANGLFLRIANSGSNLCLGCHIK